MTCLAFFYFRPFLKKAALSGSLPKYPDKHNRKRTQQTRADWHELGPGWGQDHADLGRSLNCPKQNTTERKPNRLARIGMSLAPNGAKVMQTWASR